MPIYVKESEIGNWFSPVSEQDRKTLYTVCAVYQVTPEAWEALNLEAARWGHRIVLIADPD
jgi:hypothetical protein